MSNPTVVTMLNKGVIKAKPLYANSRTLQTFIRPERLVKVENEVNKESLIQNVNEAFKAI